MAMSVGNSDNESTSNPTATNNNNNNNNSNSNSNSKTNKSASKKAPMGKRQGGKRPGRKPAKIDEHAKLERSRQSAKECRARKKLRYQYLEELVSNREKAVVTLRQELEMFRDWCQQLDAGQLPDALIKMIANEEIATQKRKEQERKRATELQIQDLPSTSTAGVNRLSSSSSSPSSSSPSPPQGAGNVPYSLLRQFQEKPKSTTVTTESSTDFNFPSPPLPLHSHLSQIPPPPSYSSSVTSTSLSFSSASSSSASSTSTSSLSNRQSPLIRQMAFDDGCGLRHQHHHHHHQQQQQQRLPLPHYNSKHFQFNQRQEQLHKSTQGQNQGRLISQNTTSLSNSQNLVNPPQYSKLNTPSAQSHPANQQLKQCCYQGQHNKVSPPSQNQSEDSFSFYQKPNVPTNKPNIPETSTSLSFLDDINDLINQEGGTLEPSFSSTRFRSQSNPIGMSSSTQPSTNQIQQSGITMTTPRRASSFSNSQTASNQSMNPINIRRGNEQCIFEGFTSTLPPPSFSDGDSDSSDESPSQVSRLFQSSLSSSSSSTSLSTSRTIQKRALSEPEISILDPILKKSRSEDVEMQSIFSKSPYPGHSFNEHTVASCIASTRTLNTPLGLLPRNTDSPMTTSSDMPSPAQSSQSQSTSPSPVSHPNFLDCPVSNSSTQFTNIQNKNIVSSLEQEGLFNPSLLADLSPLLPLTPTTESFLFSISDSLQSLSQHQETHQQPQSSLSNTVVCTETGLSATISEPIPNYQSYLEDFNNDSDTMETNVSNANQSTMDTSVSLSDNLLTNEPIIIEDKHFYTQTYPSFNTCNNNNRPRNINVNLRVDIHRQQLPQLQHQLQQQQHQLQQQQQHQQRQQQLGFVSSTANFPQQYNNVPMILQEISSDDSS